MTNQANKPDTPARRKGRRVVMTVYFLVVVLLVGIPLVEISHQALMPTSSVSTYRAKSCRQGLVALYQAVVDARSACSTIDIPEEPAVAKFRSALGRPWTNVAQVEKLCRDDEAAMQALESVKLLRYAEEMLVRQSAVGVASVRKKTELRMAPYLSSQPGGASATTKPINE